jgi:hypothetical protein
MTPGFLAPRRADLAAVVASLHPISDPAMAWQALAERGIIPADWVDDPDRRFIRDPGDAYRAELPTRDPMQAPIEPHPSTVAACVLYASDVSGIRAAEAAARDLAARLAPWDAPICDQVRWWTIPANRYLFASTDTRPFVNYALLFAAGALWRASPDRKWPRMFGQANEYAEVWSALAAAGARVPEGRLVDRPFSELPNPFEALAAIEATGYETLEGLGMLGDGRGAVVLVCPS